MANLFKIVELEINSRCNRKCAYCPSKSLDKSNIPKFIDKRLLKRIVDELKSIKYSGIISYHFYNEPLLHKGIYDIINCMHLSVPKAFQLLYTNGDYLTNNAYEKLINSGINHLVVTNHGDNMLNSRPNQTIINPDELIISNRGGYLFGINKPLNAPCHSPSETLLITVDGKVLLCCDDANREMVMGNLADHNILTIWNSESFVQKRELLKKGLRAEASKICKKCSNEEYVKPLSNLSFVYKTNASKG